MQAVTFVNNIFVSIFRRMKCDSVIIFHSNFRFEIFSTLNTYLFSSLKKKNSEKKEEEKCSKKYYKKNIPHFY